MTWRALWLPLLLLLVLAGLAGVLVLPDAKSVTQARSAGVGVIFTAAVGVVAFILQGWRSDRSQRQTVLRTAYKSMIGAAQIMLEQQAELLSFPFGHPYPWTISSPVTHTAGVSPSAELQFQQHDPFEEADALRSEWLRLYVEGERELLLETDRSDAVLVAWREIRKSFFDWVHRFQAITAESWRRVEGTSSLPEADLENDPELQGLDRALRARINEFAELCRKRITGLR